MNNELLVPVKDKKAAFLAINLKADAIYCSGIGFSARQNASISFEDLKEIIEYASLYDTKVFITLNTLIFENELEDLIKYLNELNKLNYDALIIQDLGLLHILNNNQYNKEIHASTQLNVHNHYQAITLKNNNVNRIVLARENNINEIKDIYQKTNMDLEVFIHGALCTSFSGQCLISSYENNQSGNKGACNQHCRFEYTNSLDNKKSYALSLKDLSIKEQVNQLKDFVYSFKIEGRLKSLNYLYSSVLYYQSILKQKEDLEMKDLLSISFNRQYTLGRLFDENGKDLSNKQRINNHGLEIGRVIESTLKYIVIETSKEITRLDSLRFILNQYEDGIVVEKFETINNKRNTYKIMTNKKIKVNSIIYLVNTRKYDKDIEKACSKYYRKNIINVEIKGKVNEQMSLKYQDQTFISEFILEEAKNNPMNQDDIIKQMSKTNDSSIVFNFINKDIDNNVFVSKTLLNEYKRNILNTLQENTLSNTKEISFDKNKVSIKEFKGYIYDVKTLEQAKALYDLNINEINLINIDIYEDIKHLFKKIRIVLPRIMKENSILKYQKYFDLPLMISELGMFSILKEHNDIHTNFSFNITNSYGLSFLKKHNVKNATLSYEIDHKNIFNDQDMDTSIIGYGHVPLMVMEYCPLNPNKDNNCDQCMICVNKQHYLTHKNIKYPLVYMNDNILEMYSQYPINIIEQIDRTKVSNIRISFTIENYQETYNIVERLIKGDKINTKSQNFKKG